MEYPKKDLTVNDIKPYTVDTSDLDFDPDELRGKYLEKINRRIRDDGFGQYQRATGELAQVTIVQ